MAKVYLWKSAQVALKQEYVGMGSNLFPQEKQFSYSGTEKKELILL